MERLTRVCGSALLFLDKTIEYEYNGIGNLLSVTVNGTTTQFGYSSAHLDRLTSYGGQTITYDAIGCPVRYGNKLLTWNKGKLVKICDDVDENSSESSESVEFTYNAYGQRVSKVYTYNPGPDYSGNFLIGSTTTYDYDFSGRLIHEACEQDFTESASVTNEFVYLYDESGIIGCAYYVNGSLNGNYYYQRNLLGDIVGIYNTSGTKVVGYAYDAFGNCTTTLGANNEFSKINHFRYRGYYLDRETGLYYLNARYYNPEWRRFISPANVSSLNPKAVNGLNLYCYAGNEPVNKIYMNSFLGGSFSPSATHSSDVYHLVDPNRRSKWSINPNVFTEVFGYIENGFSIFEGAFAAYRNIHQLPQLDKLGQISKKLMYIGVGIGLIVDMHNNFSNTELSVEERCIGFAVDGAYTVGSAALSYGIAAGATFLIALIPGVGQFAVLGGALISIGLSAIIDWLVEEYGALDSIKDWIERW